MMPQTAEREKKSQAYVSRFKAWWVRRTARAGTHIRAPGTHEAEWASTVCASGVDIRTSRDAPIALLRNRIYVSDSGIHNQGTQAECLILYSPVPDGSPRLV